MGQITGDWQAALKNEFHQPYYAKLYKTIMEEYRTTKVFPPPQDMFNAFEYTPLNDVKVPEPGMENEVTDNLSAFQNPPMTKEERRGIIWLSLKASLTVGLIFGGAAFLFILFCVFVWLK